MNQDERRLKVVRILRTLSPNQDKGDYQDAFDSVKSILGEEATYKERADYLQTIFDVRDRGYTGDAALVKHGLLEIEDISEEGLDNLEERTRAWNKEINFFGAGSLRPDDPKGTDDRDAAAVSGALNAADGLAAETGSNLTDVTKASKAGGKVIEAGGIVRDAHEIYRGVSLANKIKAERKRRENETKGIVPDVPVPQSEIDPNDTEKGFGPGADRRSRDQKDEVSETHPAAAKNRAEHLPFDPSNADAKRVYDAFAPADGFEGSTDMIALKQPGQLTQKEADKLVYAYMGMGPGDPRKLPLQQKARDFYVANYGTGPVTYDDTGKQIDAGPLRPIPDKVTPVSSPSGGTLVDGLKRVAGTLASAAANDGGANVVKAVQTGLNLFGNALKVDGDPGPKTQAAVTETITRQGPGRIDEAHAFGTFNRFANDARDKPGKVSGLPGAITVTVKPLVGDAKAANTVLQAGINDLNASSGPVGDSQADTKELSNRMTQKPKVEHLKEDGVIGPKTTGAFTDALAQHGPDELAASMNRIVRET